MTQCGEDETCSCTPLCRGPFLCNYVPAAPPWACLRTFAPDRRAVIGWDLEIQGLFHISGLGGFGVTTSLAIGDLASTLIRGGTVDWVEAGSFSAQRKALMSVGRQLA